MLVEILAKQENYIESFTKFIKKKEKKKETDE